MLLSPAYFLLEDYPNAIECLLMALKDAPSDRAMQSLLVAAREGLANAKKQESEVWGSAMRKQLQKDAEADLARRRSQQFYWLTIAAVVGVIAVLIGIVSMYAY